jgi:uncharacterized circularly permuted ATP-grasp superfamily protein
MVPLEAPATGPSLGRCQPRTSHRAAASENAVDPKIAKVFSQWVRAQPETWLAAELNYDLSNVIKILAGGIKPGRVIMRLSALREEYPRCFGPKVMDAT